MNLVVLASISLSTLCIYRFFRGLWEVDFTPGPRPMFSPLSAVGAILPACTLNPTRLWYWIERKTAYFNRTHDIIAFVPWLVGGPTYWTSSLDVMKHLLGSEAKIHIEKPENLTLARLWGHNVTSANGDVWRRHRRVVSPAFNNKTYSDVWRTVRIIYQEMMDVEGWNQQDAIVFDEINSVILKFTFIIICRCGFGFITPWSRNDHTYTKLPEALRIVSETLIPRIILPKWVYKLPIQRLRQMDDAWWTVATAVTDLIEMRRADNLDSDASTNLPTDILNCLVSSWINEDKHGLTEGDVIANMFSLMFAGHETTASGLVTTLTYLALYPIEQQKAYEEISRAFAENDPSEPIEQNKLTFTLHCFWEAQRLCPSAVFIPRQVTEDTIISIRRPKQEKILLRKGNLVIFDLVGSFRNPDAFQDPERFKPDRWTSISEHEVGTFGFGPRACIGRRFAQTEALAFLSTLLFQWRVEINPLPGEGKAQYEDRVIGHAGITGTAFGLKRVPLRLARRNI